MLENQPRAALTRCLKAQKGARARSSIKPPTVEPDQGSKPRGFVFSAGLRVVNAASTMPMNHIEIPEC
jgi:hypothetical protein